MQAGEITISVAPDASIDQIDLFKHVSLSLNQVNLINEKNIDWIKTFANEDVMQELINLSTNTRLKDNIYFVTQVRAIKDFTDKIKQPLNPAPAEPLLNAWAWNVELLRAYPNYPAVVQLQNRPWYGC